MTSILKESLTAAIRVKEMILGDEQILNLTEEAAYRITDSLKKGHRVLFCGNGGSAADAQHLAAELSGRFYLERKALNAEAININIPFLTAVSNDYDFGYSYARYLEGAAAPGDVLVLLSTSGNSQNIVRAAEYAADNGIFIISLTGKTGGKLAGIADLPIKVPSEDTPRIQEAHMLLGHAICQMVEKQIFQE
ncbi:MAG: D-sedoheptulose-7-phosphate isomerase [Bacteroidota bacterium]